MTHSQDPGAWRPGRPEEASHSLVGRLFRDLCLLGVAVLLGVAFLAATEAVGPQPVLSLLADFWRAAVSTAANGSGGEGPEGQGAAPGEGATPDSAPAPPALGRELASLGGPGDPGFTALGLAEPRQKDAGVRATTEPSPSPAPTLAPTGAPTPPTASPSVADLDRLPRRPVTYRVLEGDTLLKIAFDFGVTPETILWANDLGNGELIRAGQELTILPVSGVLHKVRSGDTLAGIAEAYGADRRATAAFNLLAEGSRPPEGTLVIVPGGIPRTTEPILGPPPPPGEQELAAAPRYTVREGDTLISIADAFGVRPSVIQVSNGLMDPDLLQVGRPLAIPRGKTLPAPPATVPTAEAARVPSPTLAPTATAAPPTSTAPPATASPGPGSGGSTPAGKYTVKAGDTLYSIARAHGVRPADLQAANGLSDPNLLKAGQQLTIPGSAPSTQAATPRPTAPTPEAPRPTATPTRVPTTATRVPPPPVPTARPAGTASAPGSARPTPARTPSPPSAGERIAGIAQKYLGNRYVWGGHSPKTGFDCTGFTWYVYGEAGLRIPQHDLAGQMQAGPRVAREQLLPGDLVFFQDTYMPGLSHSGVYLGAGRFINAETESVGVQVRALSDPYWSRRFVGGSRPW